MTLTLSVLRCPDAVTPETRRVKGGEFSIGRGPDNDWTLADPDRVLSKRHCVLAFRSGGWQLADMSTNGAFLNRDAEPVGQGEPRDLRDGDRLRLGNYEIEVRIEEDIQPSWNRDAPGAVAARGGQASSFSDPFGDDPFAPSGAAAQHGFGRDPLLGAPPGQGIGRQGVQLPADYDPLAPDAFDAPFTGPTQSDHAPGIGHSFRLPASPIPDDEWDIDLSTPAPPAPLVRPVSPPARPAAPLQPEAIPDPFDDGPIVPPMVPAARAAPPAPPVQGDPFAADPFAETPRLAPVAPPPAAMPIPVAPMPSPPFPVIEPAVRSPFAEPSDRPAPVAPVPVASADLMAAFLRGAGLDDARPADPVAAMEGLGQAFRALVSGLRQALIARATVKGEFRIEQTMIRARGNNPLKFSAGDDDALGALLGTGRRSDMTPAAAIANSLRDMRLHELATMAAMQTAVRALMERLNPAPLRAEGDKAGGMLPAQKRARAFELFERLHGEISAALADDFDSVFGKAFARAYEQALREAADRETN